MRAELARLCAWLDAAPTSACVLGWLALLFLMCALPSGAESDR